MDKKVRKAGENPRKLGGMKTEWGTTELIKKGMSKLVGLAIQTEVMQNNEVLKRWGILSNHQVEKSLLVYLWFKNELVPKDDAETLTTYELRP